MDRILILHTTGDWWESRYFYKQIPALYGAGYSVTYLIRSQNNIERSDFDIIQVSKRVAKWSRITGGLNLFNKIIKLKCQVIQISNIELLPLGVILAIFTRKKVFYDCLEDHYHAMLQSKTNFPKVVRILLALGVKFTEFLASLTFTGFIVSDPAIYKMHKYMPDYKKVLFYNMPLKSQFCINDLDPKKKYDITVLGSMSVRTGVLNVIEAIAALKHKGIILTLKLIGNPKIDKKLWRSINELMDLENLSEQIHITGKVSYDQIPFHIAECRIGIIPLLDLPKFRNNIAMKLFEYMALCLPVISTDLPPQKLFIKEGFNGLFYKPGNVTELIDTLTYLVNNPKELARIGSNGRRLIIESWNAENQQIKYLNYFKIRLAGKQYHEDQLPPINF